MHFIIFLYNVFRICFTEYSQISTHVSIYAKMDLQEYALHF